jgi:asparagine synthase (glutamine-hydrolysing)
MKDPELPRVFGAWRSWIYPPMGYQPMLSVEDRYVMIFNGEVHHYVELRTESKSTGCEFRGTSDTEVMLAGISDWSPGKAVPRFWKDR